MALEYDFENSVGCWVALTSHALRRALDAELAREGITFRQWEVLAWITTTEEPSQVELAACLGIEAPTLAGILSRMERDGLLERRCCEEDRRRKRLRVTPQAEAIWNRGAECCRQIRERATRNVSAEELCLFKSICERIRTNVGDATVHGRQTTESMAAAKSNA